MTTDATSNSPLQNPAPAAKARVGRLIGFAFLAVLLFGGAIIFFGFFDGVTWLRSLTAPPLASAKGTVRLGQEPLPQGHLMTRPIGGSGRGSIGVLDSNGNFVLKTDIDGTFVEGAEVGTHQVIVHAQQGGLALGAAAAPSVVAAKFTEFDSTPLKIEVSKDPASNVYTLLVEPNAQLNAPPPQNEKGSEAEKTSPAATTSSSAALVLEQRLPGVDENGDGKYSRDELLKAKAEVLNRFTEIDSDGNELIEGGELDKFVEALPAAPEAK